MIETLVMALPSEPTEAIVDIAVVLGKLLLLMITCVIIRCYTGGLLYPFAFSLIIPVSCHPLCHHYPPPCHHYTPPCHFLCTIQIFVTNLVKDKYGRHVIMMEQCGGCVHIDHMIQQTMIYSQACHEQYTSQLLTCSTIVYICSLPW